MIKRTLCFTNPAYLSVRNNQLIIKMPEVEKSDLPESIKESTVRQVPVEDIGVVVLDNKQITISQVALGELLDNNASIITCDNSHLPVGLMLPLCGNTIQNERFRSQLSASLPLRKQLWQQTVQSKISNQAAVLKTLGVEVRNMEKWVESVKSGDPDNLEARAAAYYWKNIFAGVDDFVRSRDGEYPNNLLNYGYAILRAVVARGLVSSGLLPTLGIHHHNRYNAYCLADDIMEPYRPYVDKLVLSLMSKYDSEKELTTDIKRELLNIPVMDVFVNGQRSPLMIGVGLTTSSLNKCFCGELRKIVYPEMKWTD